MTDTKREAEVSLSFRLTVDAQQALDEVKSLRALLAQANDATARLASRGLRVELETSTALTDEGSRPILSVRVFAELK